MPFGDMELAIRMALLAAPAVQGEPVAEMVELLKEQLNDMTEYKVAAHQLIGIPASVGISEPIEGFAKRPQDIMPAVRDMALRIELLERQAAELEWQLAESRANDKQAMAYLTQIRELVGGEDFPDMVRRCEKLRKDAGTERQIQRAAQHLPEGWRIIVEVERDAGWIDAFNPDGRRIEIDWVGSLAEQIEQAIDATMQEASHDN